MVFQAVDCYTPPMTDPRTLLAQLPETLTHSGQMAGLAALRVRLEQLAIQGMVLSVREWFQEYPHISQPFELHMESFQKIFPKRSEEMTEETYQAAQDLCQRLLCNPFGNLEVPTHIVLLMNALKWERSQADNLLAAVVKVNEGGVAGDELFAAADQAKLDARTEPSIATPDKPRL